MVPRRGALQTGHGNTPEKGNETSRQTSGQNGGQNGGQDSESEKEGRAQEGRGHRERKVNMELLQMVTRYNALQLRKEELEIETKANNAEIERMKAEIAAQMIDDDCPRISTGGYSFTLTPKTSYSKRSDRDLESEGIDYLATLRAEGFGDLIRETVNPRSLQSAVSSYVEENGGLSEGLERILRVYEYNDITRRKETKTGRR